VKRRIEVHVGAPPLLVGVLHHDADGARESSAFEYHPGWLATADRFAIDPVNLRLVVGPQFHGRRHGGSIFHGAIADTEPDGWARQVILREHARRRRSARESGDAASVPPQPLTSMDFLLAVNDGSRVGALRFRDENGVFLHATEPDRRAAPPLIELGQLLAASQAVEAGSDTAADLAYLLGRGTSVGGLRPKCTVLDEAECLSIGKFPSLTDERAVTKGEVLALRLAARAGIRAAHAGLIRCGGSAVALIRRFDRTPQGGRIMYISAATLLGVDADDSGVHAYTHIADALRQHGAAAQADIEELWRRVAFSILITNVDDHLRNHGFLHVGRGLWRLAPAFDVNPFPDRARELKTWISEDSGPEASVDALLAVAPHFRLSLAKAGKILREVEAAVAAWRSIGHALGMSASELDAFADAFEHEEREAVRRLV
jgi:serine/threonine-protein kinase HipA